MNKYQNRNMMHKTIVSIINKITMTYYKKNWRWMGRTYKRTKIYNSKCMWAL